MRHSSPRGSDWWVAAADLDESDLRWLLCKGYAEHFLDESRINRPGRRVRPSGSLIFCEQSCFALTPAGIAAAEDQSSDPVDQKPTPKRRKRAALPNQTSLIPRWDEERRELFVGENLVRIYRRRAPNQELILRSFEKHRWLEEIPNPIPSIPGVNAKRRLHDAIKLLNRGQLVRLLHFSGNGHGAGVRWEFVQAD